MPEPSDPNVEAIDPVKRMKARLASAEGRKLYARRKAVVEPVNGQIKQARGFRQFSFRGLEGVRTEWTLVSLCHSLLKLFGHRLQTAHEAALSAQLGANPLLQAA